MAWVRPSSGVVGLAQELSSESDETVADRAARPVSVSSGNASGPERRRCTCSGGVGGHDVSSESV
ncbi:hypothetical protein IWW46_005750 [Coemansia sp. RSA 2440]|nr:hypothetical protein IWW46_005750 [Coemansia sp. RSA 2440]